MLLEEKPFTFTLVLSLPINHQVRRCVVAKLKELDGAIVKKLLSENVGSLLVMLPDSFNGGMDDESKEKLRDIEVAVFGGCRMPKSIWKACLKGLHVEATRLTLSFAFRRRNDGPVVFRPRVHRFNVRFQ